MRAEMPMISGRDMSERLREEAREVGGLARARIGLMADVGRRNLDQPAEVFALHADQREPRRNADLGLQVREPRYEVVDRRQADGVRKFGELARHRSSVV